MKKKLSLALGILFASWMIYWLYAHYFVPPVFVKEIISAECEPPCWRGISPGKTTGNEAHEIISKFPDRINGNVNDFLDGYYSFDLSNGLHVVVYKISDVVVMITFYREEGLITFGEAIDRFGIPQYATQSFMSGAGLPILPTSTWHTYFNVLNVERGVALSFDTYRHFFPVRAIVESSVITDVAYFDPKQTETLLKDGSLIIAGENLDLSLLNIWKGYGDIAELYPYIKH